MATKKTIGIEDTLIARGKQYGAFVDHAQITQELKAVMYDTPAYQESKLTPSQREALEMIQHKVGRILNGNPNHADSWHDIAGYALLVELQLQGKGV